MVENISSSTAKRRFKQFKNRLWYVDQYYEIKHFYKHLCSEGLHVSPMLVWLLQCFPICLFKTLAAWLTLVLHYIWKKRCLFAERHIPCVQNISSLNGSQQLKMVTKLCARDCSSLISCNDVPNFWLKLESDQEMHNIALSEMYLNEFEQCARWWCGFDF